MLRRERKRRLDAASAFRDGGRAELADGEEAEARVIEDYLPAELSDEELRAIVAAAVAEPPARARRKDMGAGHEGRDGRGRRARRRQARVQRTSGRRCGA